MNPIKIWKKYHKFQKKPGWCGPAVIQMALSYAGVRKRQETIAKAVYKDWWGTSHQLMYAYLKKFFKEINFKNHATVPDLIKHIEKGHIVIVNWWDNLDLNVQESGHYSIAIAYNKKTKTLTLADPSNERSGIWDIEEKEFKRRWYDLLDEHGDKWVEGWLLWINPASRIKS